ncbi:putative RNA-directed DNA polymerase, eukaryota, reverse transcriptase zinc-binding domain protein [Tanacetum coccineum]|uniref:RNA-directed DNA polymerase, eukaryota, reverse transcriptase zinc-binding domain protein n=1 Tax=Tanacetum coccineum TaxID=301880 RepID=A0ABQ4YJG6_9ASTR
MPRRQGVYSESGTSRPKFSSNRFKRLSEIEANLLEVEFEENEVWEAVKAVRWFWENERISRGCNPSFVVLILKIIDPISLGDFWPISLLGCYYKIIAKILAERLKKVIDKLIEEVQSAFIKDRFILDGVLLVNEVVDFIKKSKNSCLIFKVDFEKAYDCVNWEFLYEVTSQMGFERKWCGWIRACLETATSSILVNGLNIMMQEVLNSGLLEGIKIGSDEMEEIEDYARSLECRAKKLPFLYLGLLIGNNMGRIENWNIMAHKFKSKLADSKAEMISFGGRLTFVKSERFFGEGRTGDSKHMVWVNWEKALSSYGMGGLNIDSLKAMNWALLSKWWWRFQVENEALWVKVGDGKAILFWDDTWVGGRRLRDQFPRWKISDDGKFSVNIRRDLIDEKTLGSTRRQFVTPWCKSIPKNVCVFIWRLYHGRFPVCTILDDIGFTFERLNTKSKLDVISLGLQLVFFEGRMPLVASPIGCRGSDVGLA